MLMRFSRIYGYLQTATTIALLGVASAARAQSSGLALDRFDPAPAGDRMFGVPSPYAAGPLTPHIMLLGDYAHNPLVLRSEPSNERVGAVVGDQLYLNLDVALSLWNRLFVDVDVPVALLQSGDSPNAAGQAFSSPNSVQFGDLRLGARVRLVGEYQHDPFQIAVGGNVWAPTGAKNEFVSSGQVRGLPQLILGGRVVERLVWSAAGGPELERRTTFANIEQGSMFKWGAGFGILLLENRHLQIGPEVSGDVAFHDVQKRTTNAEALLDVRYRIVDDIEVAAGAGPGLTSGVGTPDVRALLSLAYTPEQKLKREPPPVAPPVDPCADKTKEGCAPPPPLDTDGDGIIDSEDACPEVKGVATDDPKTNGCPADRDGDGIIDTEDACPDEKGIADPDPKKNGCPKPVDSDGDGILDPDDACPNEKGVADPDPKKNGCPKSVRVSESEILILDQVQFDTGKAVIKKVSDDLLDQVANVLREHPEITKIEVQGHTDDRGSRGLNDTLSQARANAVMTAMVKRGIVADRLTAKGYGQNRPLVENTTEEGRQKNRRVQFIIVEKQPKETH